MESPSSTDAHVRALIDAAIAGQLTDSQAEELSALGQEVTKLALLFITRRIAQQDARIAELQGKLAMAGPDNPSTASGQKPPYVKPTTPKCTAKPGARAGHVGARRPQPRRIDRRLMDLAEANYADADADRLAKRLLKHCDSSQSPFRDLFTFLDRPEVPYDNNLAERMIRPPVIPGGAQSGIRKNSRSNRSEKGAATQASLMSIYRTLKLRGSTGLAAGGLDPVAVLAAALRTTRCRERAPAGSWHPPTSYYRGRTGS